MIHTLSITILYEIYVYLLFYLTKLLFYPSLEPRSVALEIFAANRLASKSDDPIVVSGKFIYFYHFLTAIFLYQPWSVPKRKEYIR